MAKVLEFIVGEKNWYQDEKNVCWHKDCGQIHLDMDTGNILRYRCKDVLVYRENSYKDKDGNWCTTIGLSVDNIVDCMTEKTKRQMLRALKKELGEYDEY